MFIKAFFSILLLSPLHATAYYRAWSKPRPISIDLQYHNYSDLVNDGDNAKLELEDTYSLGANIRTYRIFSLVVGGTIASKGSLKGFGLGLRIDLPGILFIGGAANDLVRARKKHSFNTYFQWMKLSMREDGSDNFVSDRIGFGMDSFLTDQLYFNLELMTYSHKGNQFFALGAGFGFEF